jgi:DNA-binding MarR family transcriptional regulator
MYSPLVARATFVHAQYTWSMSSSQRTSSTRHTEPTRWLSAAEMRAWRGWVDTIGPLSGALEADLVPFGLTNGDYEVLAWLSDAPDTQMRMCDLAERLRLSPSGLTRRLDGLVTSGLVSREPSADDRRVMLARLTPAGRAHLERTAPHHLDRVRHHFRDLLDPAEIDALGRAFDKVRAHLRGEQNDRS